MGVRIVLADDHPIVRQGMRHLLETQKDLEIIGEAEDGLQTVRLVDELKPDILIVDMMMPGLNGLEALRQVKKLAPKTHVIILSMQSADSYVLEAVKGGASGYILKETGPSELIQAIHKVIAGETFLSPKLSERLSAGFVESGDDTLRDPYELLTTREREILQMAAEGMSSTEMGEKLVISPRTVETHRSRLMRKLGLRNQTELVRYALQRGILEMKR